MALEDLEKKLYRKPVPPDVSLARKAKAESPPPSDEKPAPKPQFGSEWGKVVSPGPSSRRSFEWSPKAKSLLSFFLGFLVVVVAGFFLFQYLYSPQELTLSITGPREVRSGERAEYEVFFENQARSPMKETSVTFRAGSAAQFAEAPEQIVISRTGVLELTPGSRRKEIVSLRFFGQPGEERDFEVIFRYQLGNLATRFEESQRFKVTIASPSITFDLNMPSRVISQDPFRFSIGWKNVLPDPISQGFVNLELPAEFELVDVDPKPEEGKTRWPVKNLAPDASETITLTGKLLVPEGEVRRLKVNFVIPIRGELIVISSNEAEIALIGNPLSLAISVNNFQEYIATPGEALEYRISFKNNFELALRDVIITVLLDSPMYDLAAVSSDGSFSSKNRTITWHGGNTPQLLSLATQEFGAVTFRVKVRDSFSPGQSQNTLKVVAQASSPTKPKSLGGQAIVSAQAEKSIKIHGRLEITAPVFRQDPKAKFTNTGPIPPKVNQATEYSAHIRLASLGNDFRDIFARTVLPNGVTFTGKTSGNVSGTDFIFNPRTNELLWQIPRIAAFESREVIFQISATPSLTQVGQSIEVLAPVEAAGIDDWTGNEVTIKSNRVESDLPDDPTIDFEQGRVRS